MMRGHIFSNPSICGSSIHLAIIIFLTLYLVNLSDGKKSISRIPNTKVNSFKISGSLRYLSKAVFTKAIVGGNFWTVYNVLNINEYFPFHHNDIILFLNIDSLPIRNSVGIGNLDGPSSKEIPAIKRLARKALLASNQEDSSDCTKR